ENQGFTLVDNGWEGDLTTGLRITLPVASNTNGSVITGRVRSEYILTSPASTQDLTRPPAYEAVSTNNSDATLTRRVHQHDPKQSVRVRRLQRHAVSWCAQHHQGVPERRLRYQSHL